MWKIKIFKTKEAQQNWCASNKKKYQITQIFVNNGYGVEYKKLKRL